MATYRLARENGRWYLPVPRGRADELRERLKERGYPTTVCLEPYRAEARLEVWPGVDPERVLAALEDLGRGDRVGTRVETAAPDEPLTILAAAAGPGR